MKQNHFFHRFKNDETTNKYHQLIIFFGAFRTAIKDSGGSFRPAREIKPSHRVILNSFFQTFVVSKEAWRSWSIISFLLADLGYWVRKAFGVVGNTTQGRGWGGVFSVASKELPSSSRRFESTAWPSAESFPVHDWITTFNVLQRYKLLSNREGMGKNFLFT